MDIFEILLSASFWTAAIRIASPLIFATLGELICERREKRPVDAVEYLRLRWAEPWPPHPAEVRRETDDVADDGVVVVVVVAAATGTVLEDPGGGECEEPALGMSHQVHGAGTSGDLGELVDDLAE